ncbi:MAG TPA: ATP-grasp domain-containing protein [Gaiellaceae bacterium]
MSSTATLSTLSPPAAVELALVARGPTTTNVGLLRAFRRLGIEAELVHPDALVGGREPDVAFARLDVRPTLDGVEQGFFALRRSEQGGLPILNPPGALAACHDKLVTALRLGEARLPHPRTAHVDGDGPPPSLEPPYVVKPRFGSWGCDVTLSRDARELARRLRGLARRPWFALHGALVQEFLPSGGRDLRLVVAGGAVVGAVERRARRGEWRTNVALGATRHPVAPPTDASALAVAAAEAVGADLVGVDLIPTPSGWVVLELNGAVDFTDDYSFGDANVFDLAAERLAATIGLGGLSSAGAPLRAAPARRNGSRPRTEPSCTVCT